MTIIFIIYSSGYSSTSVNAEDPGLPDIAVGARLELQMLVAVSSRCSCFPVSSLAVRNRS